MLEDARRQTQRVGQRNTKTAEDTQEDAQRSHLKRHSSGRSPRFILRFTTWFFQRKSSMQAPCKLLTKAQHFLCDSEYIFHKTFESEFQRRTGFWEISGSHERLRSDCWSLSKDAWRPSLGDIRLSAVLSLSLALPPRSLFSPRCRPHWKARSLLELAFQFANNRTRREHVSNVQIKCFRLNYSRLAACSRNVV